MPLIFLLGVVFFWAFQSVPQPAPHYPESFTPSVNPETFHVQSVEITYAAESQTPFVYRFYKIDNINGIYYSNTGKIIDPTLIQLLTKSFTDLYEGHEYAYDNFFNTDYQPHFTVVITLENGKELVLESRSSYHCFIPWNLQYNGVSYVQYNGKIPSALLPLLLELDREEWSRFYKLSSWGCYEPAAPERYVQKGYSQNFPVSLATVTPEEESGKDHLLWEVNLTSMVSSPCYSDGRVFVTLKDRIVCLDGKTGEGVWEIVFEKEGEIFPFLYGEEPVIAVKGAVFVGAPDSWVYCLDSETGSIRWKYQTTLNRYFPVKVVGDNLFVLSGGITCLDRETGKKIWEITDDTWNEEFYDDKILLGGRGEDMNPYYALVDMKSGEILWKENLSAIQNPIYDGGFLYFSIPREGRIVSLDIKNREQAWTYLYVKSLGCLKVSGEKIVLLQVDSMKESLYSLTLLDKKGSKIWEYLYPEGSTWLSDTGTDFKFFETIVFFLREGGIIQAFKTENGDLLWEIEVRGTEVTSFEIYENRIYVSANDGYFYCLDSETGSILWKFDTENGFTASVFSKEYIYVSYIGDHSVFVATKEGHLFAFSL